MDETNCALCDHPRDDHGDGVVHTACRHLPPGAGLDEMCDCPGWEAPADDEVVARTKDVTRRMGWLILKPGDRLTLCRKVMGRRKGEPLVRITDVEVVSVRREPLNRIDLDEVIREGFPNMTPWEFVEFFCASHKGCRPDSVVTRIEWRYV